MVPPEFDGNGESIVNTDLRYSCHYIKGQKFRHSTISYVTTLKAGTSKALKVFKSFRQDDIGALLPSFVNFISWYVPK